MTGKIKGARSKVTGSSACQRQGRPRSTASHDAILTAALKLLYEKGYRGVTIEGIASAAAVGKQTIYRWWRSKADVILEAYTRHAANRFPVPDSGDLRTDLTIYLTNIFDNLTRESGEIVRALMSEALVDQEFAESMRTIFIASRRSALREILLSGQQRGELNPQMDLDLMIDLIYGPMWYRLLNQHAPLDSRFAEQLAEVIATKLAWVE